MNARIFTIRKALGFTQERFGECIGLKQNAISQMEQDGNKVTEKNIKAICTLFHVNEEWLRTGSGPMFLEDDRRRAAILENFERLSPALKDFMIATAKNLLEAQTRIQNDPEADEQEQQI